MDAPHVPNKWDNRDMFEHFLYDYLRKNNMHHTAETFKQEANLKIELTKPPAIDVPDGFLHEWWLLFYDTFSARQQQRNTEHNGGPSIMDEQMMKTRPQSNASLSREYDINAQTFGHLAISADHGLTTGDNLMPSMGWPLTGNDLLASQSGNFVDLIGQEVGSTVHAASRMVNVAPNERSRKGKNQSNSEDVSSNMLGLANFPSEALSAIQKSSYDHVKPSSSHANDNKDGVGASSSNLLTRHVSREADVSEAREVERILKEWCDSFSSSP